jgi:hypothetical protein
MRLLLAVVLSLAAACMGQAAEIPDVLGDAKVGEWVLYDLSNGNAQARMTITAVSDTEVTVKTVISMDGQVLREVSGTYPRDTPAPGSEAATGGPDDFPVEVVEIGGRDISCVVIEAEASGVSAKTWISNEVGVQGVVRSEAPIGNVVMQLVEFGN